MTRNMPIVTEAAVMKALESELDRDESQYDQEFFGLFTSEASRFFANYGPRVMIRTQYNICYRALQESGNLPILSRKSLTASFGEVAEETTGKSVEDIGKGILWHKGFAKVFDREKIRLERENPNYLSLMGRLALIALDQKITSTSMPLTAGVVVYRAMEKEIA